MFNLILGEDIATYLKRHRGMVICALVLMTVSSLFVLVPAYLLQPFIDEGMKMGSSHVTWKIPWLEFDAGSWFPWKRTELTIVEGITPNRLLALLTLIAAAAVFIKSITSYFGGLSAAAFSNRAVKLPFLFCRQKTARNWPYFGVGFNNFRFFRNLRTLNN
jgi:subfamily B ATP-binding cassette protein MsbA